MKRFIEDLDEKTINKRKALYTTITPETVIC